MRSGELLTMPRLMSSKKENLQRLCRFLKIGDDADFLALVCRIEIFVGWNPVPKPVERTQAERDAYEAELMELFAIPE